MTLPFYTIGHSNRSLEEFTALLVEFDIGLVADIRRFPMSRTNPQFNEDTLPAVLDTRGISYEHIAALGGLRGKAGSHVPAEINGFWTNRSFHRYADYALSGEFHAGLEHLRAEGRQRRCALMCAEAVWWRCHRRIVSDYLIASGETVIHIVGQGRSEPARLTSGAVVQPGPLIGYPAPGPPVI